ncbi:MAG TPA: ABC transporter substrate-binding protein [Acidimicrobiales bacterium]|nr:ABC transporter substrate-binding protein [Acidimicrobiales bacterium]
MSKLANVRLRALGAALLVALLVGPAAPSPASASHLPSCFGYTPTIFAAASGGVTAGTPGDDVILGTPGADRISGGGGDDIICGLGGNDDIAGGDGVDEIDAGGGNDRVTGGGGEDLLSAGAGNDQVAGSPGDDLARGQDGLDAVSGGRDLDACEGESVAGCEGTPRPRLVVGETFAIPTTNPAVSTAGSVHAYWEIMYNGLLALDEEGNPIPELAIEVPTVANGGILDGGATYILRLRDDVFWHDGHQFTAVDVKFTFEKALLVHHARTRNMATALASWNPTTQTASIDVLDPFTVRFRFARPYAPLLQQLNVTEAPMIPAHRYVGLPASAYDANGNPTLATLNANRVGTGPFMYGGVTATEARVVRNPRYFRAPEPYLEEIVMRPLIDDAARINALLTGAVDFVWDVPNPDVASLAANAAFRTAATQSLGGGPNSIDQLIFNLTMRGTGTPAAPNPEDPARWGQVGSPHPDRVAPPHPVLGALDLVDPDGPGGPAPAEPRGLLVRRAIFHAINRQAYLDVGRNGIGTVATAPISSELPQHATDIVLPAHDPAAANRLLDAAGWDGPRTPDGFRTSRGVPGLPDGTPLRLLMLAPSNIFTARIALLDADLAAVGIDLVVEVDAANANNRVFVHRNFDIFLLNYAQGFDPHIGVRRQYHSDQVSIFGTPNNAPGYKNALVDAAFDQAVQTIDPVVRFELYHAFQVQVARDLPYVWLIETPNVRGWTAKCYHFKVYTGLFAERAYCRT